MKNFYRLMATTALMLPSVAQAKTEPAVDASATQDIIVTAQRREERIQDVPIVVNVFSSRRIEELNIKQPQDLQGLVPSMVVGNQGTSSREAQSFSIRGQSTGYQSSPAVVIYLNEVPLPNTSSGLQGAPGLVVDLENVQVLSGPQGTLFGRNTTGGAVLYTARKPTERLEGYVEGSVGNYDMRGLEGVLNVPLIKDKLLVRAVGAYQDRRGYTRDIVWDKWRDDTHWYSGRIGITMRPTERLENYLMLYGSNSSNNGTGHIHQSFNIGGLSAIGFCQEGPSIPFAISSCDVYRRQSEIAAEIGPRRTRLGVDAYSKIKTWGAINTTTFELSDYLTLKNIASYQRLITDSAWDQDATPLQQHEVIQNQDYPDFPIPGLSEYGLPPLGYTNNDVRVKVHGDRQITEELQLQGKMLDGKLDFATGFFFSDSKPSGVNPAASVIYCPAAVTGLCPINISAGGNTNRSKAVYAQSTLNLGAFTPSLDGLRLTTGVRYTWDKVGGFTDRALLSSATLRSDAPTWTVGLDYKPVKDVLLYAKASHGYKAGGFNSAAVRQETLTFDPEKLTTYEGGFKSDWLLGSVPLRLNGTYYYSKYSNIQRPTDDFNTVTGQSGAQVLAAKATIQGFETEASIRPIPAIEIGGSLSHTKARYTEYNATVYIAKQACNGLVPAGTVADYSCFPFQFVSPWIYNVHASIDLPIPESAGALSAYVNYSHMSSQPTAPLGNALTEPGSLLEPRGLLNASLSWRKIAGIGVDLTLFATNLTDKTYRVSNSNVFGALLYHSVLYGEPRMYGLKLRYSFGGGD